MAVTTPTTFGLARAVRWECARSRALDERDGVARAARVGQHHHVHQRHHHLAHGGVAEVEDLVDHLGFLRAHRGLAGLELQQSLQLLARHELRVSARGPPTRRSASVTTGVGQAHERARAPRAQ
jgi:hypothetical protein